MEEACEYGLPSGTCFTARRLEVIAVVGRLWIYFVVCFFSVSFFFRFIYFELTRPTASTRQPCLMYLSTSTDCESCTKLISTNPGSMEAGEYGLTRGTCFFARSLEMVAVAGMMWVSWCVFGGAARPPWSYLRR